VGGEGSDRVAALGCVAVAAGGDHEVVGDVLDVRESGRRVGDQARLGLPALGTEAGHEGVGQPAEGGEIGRVGITAHPGAPGLGIGHRHRRVPGGAELDPNTPVRVVGRRDEVDVEEQRVVDGRDHAREPGEARLLVGIDGGHHHHLGAHVEGRHGREPGQLCGVWPTRDDHALGFDGVTAVKVGAPPT
jgi:hypothetical protein